jgi:hypothetical protein
MPPMNGLFSGACPRSSALSRERLRRLLRTSRRKGNEAAGEPDVVCALGHESRGIEVVDCWYSEGDAETV